MFFGMPPGGARGGGPGVRVHTFNMGGGGGGGGGGNQMAQLGQLLPLLLLFGLSFFSYPSSMQDPIFSLSQTNKYSERRDTRARGVTPDIPYFVTESFGQRYARDPRSLRMVEQSVEQEFEYKLRNECYVQKEQQHRLMYQARARRTKAEREQALERAQAFELSSCKKLTMIFGG